MAGSIKHGSHKFTLALAAAAAGAANDAQSLLTYDGFAEGAATAAGYVYPYDATAEQVIEANVVAAAAVTGVATNFFSLAFQQYRAGAVVNDIRLAFSAAGNTLTAYTPVNLNAAGGAVATGSSATTLTVQTGVALPWGLVPGDVLVLARISAGTGLASPNLGLTFRVKQFGS